MFLTVLLAVLGFAFSSQFSDSPSYYDGSDPIRIAKVESSSGGAEPPWQADIPLDALLFSALFMLFMPVPAILAPVRNEVRSRPTFFSHVRPRSPPSL
ncbi:hypothetical protein LG198_11350 [Methylobacillus arboreus]|uniref:hypothetical protein n=1 Tax=Methylobacillus arboreus TaxID=755170 RepID=UPI001E3F0D3F|nr:hypothetical protein [Methylobacillus arboreus]MCB5191323.1 hypothetical protein [Methylobacillus arboreus]